MKYKATLILLILFSVYSTVFGITLEDAIDYAMDNAPGIRISHEESRIAELDRYSSIGNFLPRISLNAGYTKLDSVPTFSMPTPLGVREIKMAVEDNYSVEMQLSVPIFMGGKLINGYLISREQSNIKTMEYAKSKSDIKMAVIQVYLSGLLMDESIAMIRSLLKAKEEHLQNAESRYQSGNASKLELLSAQTQYNAVEPRVSELESARENLVTTLKILIGMPIEENIRLDTELKDVASRPKPIDIEKRSSDELSSDALIHRKDIKISQKNMYIVEKAALMAKLAFLPNIVGFASNSYKNIPNDTQDSLIIFSDTLAIDQSFTWGVSMSFDVLSGGSRILDIMKSGHREKQIKMAYANMENQVKAEVKQLHDKYKITKMNMETYESGLNLAEEAYQMAKEQYRQGIISNTDYLEAESNYLAARADCAQGLYNLTVQYYSLINAIGLL